MTTKDAYLERIGRPGLNTPFADGMIELGLRTGAESALIEGGLPTLENYGTWARTTIRRRLQKGGALLPPLRSTKIRPKAAEALERVRRALNG